MPLGKVISPFGFVFAPLSADLRWCTARVNADGETPCSPPHLLSSGRAQKRCNVSDPSYAERFSTVGEMSHNRRAFA
jgi:hypothetical protein